jgi:uncharacterized protein (DUF1684 family)
MTSPAGTTAGDPAAELADTLDLADWRRRVADLYAEVRRLSATDVAAALALWRSTRERLFREHPMSPLPPERRAGFRASHYRHDPALRFEVEVVAGDAVRVAASAPGAGPIDFGGAAAPSADLPVSAGGTMSFTKIGHVEIPFAAGARRLGVYWMAGYAGGLFIPFRDATNDIETYAAGRYLVDSAKSADLGGDAARGTLILDFNFAYQPSCAFDPKWACPLAPPENRLDIAIRAGERLGPARDGRHPG